ncbi:MAG: tetratricopeptide repeat protein, partial [Leptolyngbya sp. SIO1D8]|nr:tetratricopeptide repeat protein [Leptolyngbya sp. SIO1D8]
QALEMYQQLLGQRHPHVATSLHNLANLYKAQGHYEAAEPFYQKALTIRKQILGPDHPDTKSIKRNLQNLLEKKGSV